MSHIHRSIAVTDRSSVGEARRVAMIAAQTLGFDEGRRSDIGIVATEGANNIVLHARSGEFLVCSSQDENGVFLDLLALDSGPGIRNISQALEDGYSTIGTAGQGMGAIRRLSDTSSLYSFPDGGTVFWSRFQGPDSPERRPFGAVSVPLKGETASGDAFLALSRGSSSLYMVVDGLGHGANAAEAAQEAIATVRACAEEPITEIITRTHDALKKTRGAAMTVAIADHEKRIITTAGVGNVSVAVVRGTSVKNIATQNGTLGAVLPRVQEYTYPFESRSLLLMYSDGISTKCSLSRYPGLQSRHPQLIAGLLYRDFSRHRDDATVILASLGDEKP